MPQLRKDPLSIGWVVISSERGKRPSDFGTGRTQITKGFCPFCAGNESVTPPEIMAYREPGTQQNTPGWSIRVIPNKYAALVIEGSPETKGIGSVYDYMDGVGAHEVIIEHPQHDLDLEELTKEHRKAVLEVYKLRIEDLFRDRRFRYIQVFKNHGEPAGASLEHSHSQVIAVPVTPTRLKEELDSARLYYNYKGRCIFCDILEEEKREGIRIILENHHFVVFEPFASRFPFETWVIPKRHEADYQDISDEELWSLSEILGEALLGLRLTLSNSPYNLVFHFAPARYAHAGYWQTLDEDFHWHIEIIPRLTMIAGFEWGTGFYINPTPPEEAAHFLGTTVRSKEFLDRILITS